jgi:hypothetical protein
MPSLIQQGCLMMTDHAAEPEAANTRSKQLLQTYPQGACLFAAWFDGNRKDSAYLGEVLNQKSKPKQELNVFNHRNILISIVFKIYT